jgi:hypothetical protein
VLVSGAVGMIDLRPAEIGILKVTQIQQVKRYIPYI